MEKASRQCDDFHWVRLALGPLLALEASLRGGLGGLRRRRCCRADGERLEIYAGVVWGGDLGWKHRRAVLQGFVIPLRLLASPVEAAGCERVMGPQVASAVGHAQTVVRLSGEGHLHRNGALERQRPRPRLEARGKVWVGGEATA